ncbi:hypothetical protein [Natronorubrum daqingense]|uniref:Uncharacterized protein n=1 Tax=Natronorubrum daqingense TaxID=588898 RepID=A0A1N7A9M2_9EURY|nr:hypothetical protein [Natronorubrum daqingense]APX98064.1 hypothetical protein BB347_16380 [Natronorubrum daqingense]SIR35748.1 hypothetical protein SAMN05421809_1084 [Natronorubrum daqingense]
MNLTRRTSLEATEARDDAPVVDDTHVIWEATYEGEHGHVDFDAAAHSHDGPFVFYTADGEADPVTGTELDRDSVEDDDCEPLDEYVEVEPDDGHIVLELTAS